MRRIALLGLTLLLPGCQFVGNPFDGFTGFIADTHTWTRDPTAPTAQSVTEERVRGDNVAVEPLLPEPGDVWPGPPAPIPTMQDLQNMQHLDNGVLPPPNIPNGKLTPVFPQNAPAQPGTTNSQ